MADIQKLISEIRDDPLARGYVAMTAAQVHTDLHTKYRTRIKLLASQEVLEWLADSGRFERIIEGQAFSAGTAAQNRAIRSICRAIGILVRNPQAQFDFSKPQQVSMFDALINAGILTADDRAAAQTLVTESVSRDEELGIGGAAVGEVEFAKEVTFG